VKCDENTKKTLKNQVSRVRVRTDVVGNENSFPGGVVRIATTPCLDSSCRMGIL